MTQKAGDPQISWMTIVGAISVVGLMTTGQWIVNRVQFDNIDKVATATNERLDKYLTKDEYKAYLAGEVTRFDSLSARVTTLEQQQVTTLSKLAHSPVEQATVDAINSAVDKRIDLIQQQITATSQANQAQIADLNRQIAAALIIIDNNAASPRKSAPTLPP